MEFEQSLYDFGRVKLNTSQQHEIRFKNSGEDTLIILSEPKTASSADVARMKVGKMKYAPNEEGIVIYKFDTKSPKIFNNNITIQTNSTIASAQIVRVHWEVLSDSDKLPYWEEKINAHPRLNNHLDSLAKDNCYMRSGFSLEMPVINGYDGPCDSIRIIAVEELGGLFNSKELVDIFTETENYLTKLISFEALTRTSFKADSLAQLLDSFVHNYGYKYEYELKRHFLDIISPIEKAPIFNERYIKSTKLDLDDYYYLQDLFRTYYNPDPGNTYKRDWTYALVWGGTKDSFHVLGDTIDFGTIDLRNFTKKEFVLRKNLRVYSTSDKLIIIAPYTDANTTCDKRSYRLDSEGEIVIDFRCVVELKKINQSVLRCIKLVDYQTKKEKLVWIKAYFINYKNE
jgi:hypothetical protein